MPTVAAVTYKKPNVYIDDADKLLYASDDPFRQPQSFKSCRPRMV
jgi:hypothetical protein